MDAVLYINDAVVTERTLSRAHKGEAVVCVKEGAIVTPTARDYVRQHRVELVEGEVQRQTAGEASASARGQLVQEVRCEHPERSHGCEKEEFGSGYVEPEACESCAIRALQLQGKGNAGCEGCNLHKGCGGGGNIDMDELVREITDLVVDMLKGKGQ